MNSITPQPFTVCLLDANKDTDSNTVLKLVHRAVQQFKPTVLSLAERLKKARVDIIEPSSQQDNTLVFTAGLALHVKLVAMIENITDTSTLRIKVQFLIELYGNLL